MTRLRRLSLAAVLASAAASLTLTISVEAAPTDAVETAFTKESSPLFEGAKGKVIGSVPPGTPFEVMKRSGGRTQVRLHAWSRGYSPLNLVADPKSMTPRAQLVRIPDGARVVGKEKVDKYEARWEQVTLTAWIKSSTLVKEARTVWQTARELQRERCTVCHGFYEADKMSPSQWRGTLVIMAHRASLTPEEHALISHYLQSNARPSDPD